jgi:hypothetical protein
MDHQHDSHPGDFIFLYWDYTPGSLPGDKSLRVYRRAVLIIASGGQGGRFLKKLSP